MPTQSSEAGVELPANASTPARAKHKRRRIALACNPCRSRKMKCNGDRPVCSSCQRLQRAGDCIYESGILTKKSLDTCAQTQRPSSYRVREPVSSPAVVQINQTFATGIEVNATVPSPLSTGERLAVDALNAVPDSPTNHLSSGSSALAFTRTVARTIEALHKPTDPSQLHFSVIEDTPQHQALGPEDLKLSDDPFALPIRTAADRYVKCFFDSIHPIFPVLHQPDFHESYHRLWTTNDGEGSGGSSDPIFLATVYLVFALGSHFSSTNPREKRVSISNRFYQRSRKLVTLETLDLIPFQGIQLLLLHAVYLQSSHYASRCWNVVGTSIRAAQSLGLHQESDGLQRSQKEREIRRRVWYTGVILDRLVALVFHRPMILNSTLKCPLPQMVDDEYLLEDGEGRQPPDVPSRMGLFVSSIKLFNILPDILTTFYSNNATEYHLLNIKASGWSQTWLTELLHMDKKLDDLLINLPPNLQRDLGAETIQAMGEDWIDLQVNVFYSRFLYIRALLLRPLLLFVAQHGSSLNLGQKRESCYLEQDIVLKICVHCVSTATSLVDIKYNSLNDNYQSPPWHSIHYIFVAAILIATARLCPVPDPAFDDTRLRSVWYHCIAILEHHRPQFEAAATVLHILNTLGRCIDATKENRPNLHHQQSYSISDQELAKTQFNQQWDEQGFGEDITNLSGPITTTEMPIESAWFSNELLSTDWLNYDFTRASW